MPQEVSGFGADVHEEVMVDNVSDQQGVSAAFCVFPGSGGFYESSETDCAQAYARAPGTSGSGSNVLSLVNKDAPAGTEAIVDVFLGGTTPSGGTVYYTYRSNGPSGGGGGGGGSAVVQVPAPSSFGQTVTARKPPPGGAAVAASPELGAFGAVRAPVTVDVEGLSVRDQVIAAARHDCYVNFTKTLFSVLKAIGKSGVQQRYDEFVQVGITYLTPELAGCLALADALQQRLYAPAADVARASCAVTPVTLLFTGSGRKARLRSIRGDRHPLLKVSCVRTAGGVRISVSTRSSAPLSSVVGSRLRLGIVRSKKDSPGGQLSVTFNTSGSPSAPSWTGNWNTDFGAMPSPNRATASPAPTRIATAWRRSTARSRARPWTAPGSNPATRSRDGSTS